MERKKTVGHAKYRLNVRYRKAAEELARRVTTALGDQVDSIVLYGSVARGEARKSSDVDVLVGSSSTALSKNAVSSIRSDLMYEGDFDFLISLFHISRDQLRELVRLRSPFIREVLAEGVVLYDNGTFAQLRQQTAPSGRRSPE